MSAEENIILNGVTVTATWPQRLREAQDITTYRIGGRSYLRTPFGERSEDIEPANRGACHDCAALKGQLHVIGCDMEICPVCGGQAFICECPYEGREAEKFDFQSHEQAAVTAYLEKRHFYRELAAVVQRIIEESLRRRNSKVHSVQAREKDPRSFGRKAAEPLETDPSKPKYAKPLEQITDLAGVRIITFFPETLNLVDTVLSQEFEIIERSDKSEALVAEDRFGYRSVHYLARLTPPRIDLPEYAQFKNAIAEIQVRTVLQHAWAEIEHDIQYKSTSVIPAQIRRRFVALAGMLEIADREFQEIQNEDQRLREQARTQIKRGNLAKVEVTPDALRAFLDKLLGSDQRISDFSYEFLARTLKRLGFTTLHQLEECISSYGSSELDRMAYGRRQGQIVRAELMLLAGMADFYILRHPWAKEQWFVDRHSRILGRFRDAGVKIGSYDPMPHSEPSSD